MENKELYTYIVHSLDILNRSLTIHEQNTIKLFSYLHNGQVDLINDYNNLITSYVNKKDFNDTNKSVKDLENCVVKLNNTIEILENKINKLENQIKETNTIILETPIIEQEDEYKKNKLLVLIQKYYIWCIIHVKQIYNKCYKFIFKKKIQRELEEQERLYQEKLAEKIRQEDLERKRKIKEILNKSIKR